jgi:HD-like signal output (HDOD) protein
VATDDLARVQKYVGTMATLPVTVSKVLEVCNNPKTSPIDLDRVIQLDPVLMGRVLKLINSAYYGLGTQVTSLVRAIIMLGINTVKNLALSTAIIDRFAGRKGFNAISMDGFWRHSLCVGVTAKLIATRRGVDPKVREEYFAGGLLHDIGKIPINDAIPEEYVRVMSLADRERIPFEQAERNLLGFDHSAIGRIVADSWKLSGAIPDAVVYHHDLANYEGTNTDFLLTVAVANYFAGINSIGFAGDLYPAKLPPDVFQRLGIQRSLLDELEAPVNAEIEKAKIFLQKAK